MAANRTFSVAHLVTSGTMSGSASTTSSITSAKFADTVAYQFAVSGTTMSGTGRIEASMDQSNWFAVASGAVGQVGSGSVGVSAGAFPWPFSRAVFSGTTGTGSLDVWVTLKGA